MEKETQTTEEKLAYIKKSTADAAKENGQVKAIADALLARAEEVMQGLKEAGLLTQSKTREGTVYTDKAVVEAGPAVSWNRETACEEPMLHRDGTQVYSGTIKLRHGDTTVTLAAKEDVSDGARISAVTASMWDRRGDIPRLSFYKQADIAGSPIPGRMKAVAEHIINSGIIEQRAPQSALAVFAYDKNGDGGPRADGEKPLRTYINNIEDAVDLCGQPEVARVAAAYKKTGTLNLNAPEPSAPAADKEKLIRLAENADRYFAENSTKILDMDGHVIGYNAYAQYDEKKNAVYLRNRDNGIAVELGINENGGRIAAVVDFGKNLNGGRRSPGEEPVRIAVNPGEETLYKRTLPEVASAAVSYMETGTVDITRTEGLSAGAAKTDDTAEHTPAQAADTPHRGGRSR